MSDLTLTPEEQSDLCTLAGMIVPSSDKFVVPGADDPAIFADIVTSITFERDDIKTALNLLSGLAGAALDSLPLSTRVEVVSKLRDAGSPSIDILARHVLLCYYRDDRVMRSLGIEPRPPFPGGFTVEQGEWSLLAPVKARAPFWRKASQGT